MGFSYKSLCGSRVNRQPIPCSISQHINHFPIMLADRLPFLLPLLRSRKIVCHGAVTRFEDHGFAFGVEEGAYVAGAGWFGGDVVLRECPVR